MDMVRQLRPGEIEDSLLLAAEAFGVHLSPQMIQARLQRIEPATIWGCLRDNKLISRMALLSLDVFVHGKIYKAGGFAVVATRPEFQRQGAVSKILREALYELYRREVPLSLLAPTAFSFYRQFGWETVCDRITFTLNNVELTNRLPSKGHIRLVDPDWRLLQPIYEQMAVKYTCSLQRNEDWWMKHIFFRTEGSSWAVYCNQNYEIVGYVCYSPMHDKLQVNELFCCNEEARQELLTFIGQQAATRSIVLHTPIDDDLSFLLREPAFSQTQSPYFMGRIVHTSAFLQKYPFWAPDQQITLTLDVHDSLLDLNHGVYTLHFESNRLQTIHRERFPMTLDRIQYYACCDIGTLTSMLMGYKRPAALQRIGRLQADYATISILEKMIPLTTPWIADYF